MPSIAIRFAAGLLASLLAGLPVAAAAAEPSDASIRELLTLSEARRLVEGIRSQMDDYLRDTLAQFEADRPLTPEQKKIIDHMKSRLTGLFNQQMQYEALEPIYLQIYRQSFSQEEVDQLIAFYRSETGQMMIRKMPAVMNLTFSELQRSLMPMMMEAQEVQQQAIRDLQQLPPAGPAPNPGPTANP